MKAKVRALERREGERERRKKTGRDATPNSPPEMYACGSSALRNTPSPALSFTTFNKNVQNTPTSPGNWPSSVNTRSVNPSSFFSSSLTSAPSPLYLLTSLESCSLTSSSEAVMSASKTCLRAIFCAGEVVGLLRLAMLGVAMAMKVETACVPMRAASSGTEVR